MSKLFYDHLLVLEEVDVFIKKTSQSKEEREELWGLVDEIVHHKVLDIILGRLPEKDHHEFLELFHSHPHDEAIIGYLKGKIGENFEEILKQELGELASELLMEIKKK